MLVENVGGIVRRHVGVSGGGCGGEEKTQTHRQRETGFDWLYY